MRRHSLDPESIRKHIISVFSTSSRKRQSLTNTNNNHQQQQQHNGLLDLARRARRFSVPEEETYLQIAENNAPELHTIPEVSHCIGEYRCFLHALLAC